MKKLKITRFIDGGHSWFSVKRQLLKELGIEKEISHCSYQRGESVYLEEDSDAAKFFDAYCKKILGFSPKENGWNNWHNGENFFSQLFEEKKSYSDNSSPIRNYASYTIIKLSEKDLKEGMKVKVYGKEYAIKDLRHFSGKWALQDQNGKIYRLGNKEIDSMVDITLPLENALME